MHFTLLDEIPCQNLLGEGVQWNPHDQSVWWTDIQSSLLYAYHPATKRLTRWPAPERIACFAFAKTDSRLLVAFASGIAWWDPAGGECEWIVRPEKDKPGNRLNDGRVDRQGRFWVGSMAEQRQGGDQQASLYCLDTHLHLSRHLTGLSISNALCWSPDASRLYHADSLRFAITEYAFDPLSGSLGNGRVFARLPAGIEPDGACVDAEGCVWNAQWGGAAVVRYSPRGEPVARLELPFSQPTCVAFGGPDLRWLLVTSARQGLSDAQLAAQPRAGNLLIFDTACQGLPESHFGA